MEDKELLAWFLEHSNDGSLTELIQFKKFNFKGFTKINTPKARDFAIKSLTTKRNLPFLIEITEAIAISKKELELLDVEFMENIRNMETAEEARNLFAERKFEFGLAKLFAILMHEKKNEFTFEAFRYFNSIEEMEAYDTEMNKEDSNKEFEKRFDQINKENEDLRQLLVKQKNSYEEKLKKISKKNTDLLVQNNELQLILNATNEKNEKQLEYIRINDDLIKQKREQIKEFEKKMDNIREIKKDYETNIHMLERAIKRFKKNVLVFGNTVLRNTLLFHFKPCEVDSLEELNQTLKNENYDEIWIIKYTLPEGIQKLFSKAQVEKNIKYFDDYVEVLDELGE